MFSIGKLSRFPVWEGRDAELPSDKLPLFISLSQGDLDAVKHNTDMAIDKHNDVIQTSTQKHSPSSKTGLGITQLQNTLATVKQRGDRSSH